MIGERNKMNWHSTTFIRIMLIAGFCALSAAVSAAVAQDVVTVETINGFSQTLDVPVYIRDTSGTPLGIDQPPGSKIQSYSLKVDYSPAAAVQSITFTRAGITAGLTPTLELSPSAAGSISLLDRFQESSNPIPFTLNGAPPGNLVGHLVVTLNPFVTPGTVITLTLDPALTELTDEGGSGATKETSGNGNLALANGAINVVAVAIPAMNEWIVALLAMTLLAIGLRMRL